MPVYHEKEEKLTRKLDPNLSREPSKNRTKQREVSIERRPIISQEKPPVKRQDKVSSRRDASKDKNLTVSDPRKISVSKKPPLTSDPTTASTSKKRQQVSTQAKSHKTEQANEETKSKIKARDTKEKLQKESISSSKKVKISPREPERTRARVGTTSKQPKVIEKLPNKTVRQENSTGHSGKPALKLVTDEKKPRLTEKKHDRTRTRTLSPSEVKILPVQEAEQKGSNLKLRDSNVATIKKQTEDDEDKKESEIGQEDQDEEGEEDDDSSQKETEMDYEDDFEDYESDFEEDSDPEDEEGDTTPRTPEFSTNSPGSAEASARKRVVLTSAEERERKLDSGSYHISAAPHKREMEEIKMAMQNENRQQRKQSVVEDTDEGYLEDSDKQIIQGPDNRTQMIDFAKAGKRHKEQENQAKAMLRGQELSRMITLDTITYTLMDMPAVPYEVFMATYGRTNACQVHVQTNEDDCEEEVQTEEIETVSKWTQIPAVYTPRETLNGKKVYDFTKEERLGVGGSHAGGSNEPEPFKTFNASQLNKLLYTAAQRVLVWLESRNHVDTEMMQKTSELTSCCQGMLTMNADDKSPKEQKMPVIVTATSSDHLVLSVQKTIHSESVIKIWSVLVPSAAQKVLFCHQEVTCACFGPGRGRLVFAGAADGSLNLWDLRESSELHCSSDYGRSPTYSTAEVLKGQGHQSPIVSVIVLNKEDDHTEDDFRPIQVCSLDDGGEVLMWSVVQQNFGSRLAPNEDQGLAHWGRVRLVRSSSFQARQLLRDDVKSPIQTDRFFTMALKGSSGHEFLLATSSGQVLHCSPDGSLLKPKSYVPSKNARPSAVTTIAVYPPDDRYFLAGCSDGTIRLHSRDQARPLINLHWNLGDASPASCVKAVHWFPSRPCMFLVLDATSRIHVWNLSISDIYPQLTLPASTSPFSCAQILRPRKISQPGSVVFGRTNGLVEVHNIKTESDGDKSKEEWKKETRMFQRYVRIL